MFKPTPNNSQKHILYVNYFKYSHNAKGERQCKSPHKSETGIWVWKGSMIFLILSRIDILNSIKSISSIHDINISENHIVDTISII